jgi:hypothetical protein
MITKTCGDCKIEYPATLEYFFKKIIKAGTLMRGVPLKKDWIGLKYLCKTCHGKRSQLLKHKKRAKEVNMSLEEYQKNIEQIRRSTIASKKIKYVEFKDLDQKERSKKLRIMRLGYTMDQIDNYQVLWREHVKKVSIQRRKYQYNENMYPLTNAECCKVARQSHAPSIIALNMHIPVKDLTPQLLEIGIKSVNLKRQVKSLITN